MFGGFPFAGAPFGAQPSLEGVVPAGGFTIGGEPKLLDRRHRRRHVPIASDDEEVIAFVLSTLYHP